MGRVAIKEVVPDPRPSLADRIADALSGPITSGDLYGLLAETSAALADVTARHAREEEAILSPLTRGEQAQAARESLDRLDLDRRRLTAAVTRLEERQKAVTHDEQQAGLRAAYDDAKARHDKAVAKLVSEYEAHAGPIAAVLRAAADADELAGRVNQNLPDGAARIETVEYAARGVSPDGRALINGQWVRANALVQGVRLPALSFSTDYLWPTSGR